MKLSKQAVKIEEHEGDKAIERMNDRKRDWVSEAMEEYEKLVLGAIEKKNTGMLFLMQLECCFKTKQCFFFLFCFFI
jgi:hypothetical protein